MDVLLGSWAWHTLYHVERGGRRTAVLLVDLLASLPQECDCTARELYSNGQELVSHQGPDVDRRLTGRVFLAQTNKGCGAYNTSTVQDMTPQGKTLSRGGRRDEPGEEYRTVLPYSTGRERGSSCAVCSICRSAQRARTTVVPPCA
jgi:hypothetical protein